MDRPPTTTALTVIALLFAVCLLFGCGERASTWDEKKGRYVSTDDYRRDQINREIDKREVERERGR